MNEVIKGMGFHHIALEAAGRGVDVVECDEAAAGIGHHLEEGVT